MSKTNYQKEILDYLVKKSEDSGIRPRKLARRMGIADEEYGAFRTAYKQLRDEGRLILGSSGALTLPSGDSMVLGRFSANARGFGFVTPEDKSAHGDLFVPEGSTGGAMDGDLVLARVVRRDAREGRIRWTGLVVEVRERGQNGLIGTLEQGGSAWFVVPDGRRVSTPVLVRDVPAECRKEGAKVKVEIIWYPEGEGVPEGVIVDTFGMAGDAMTEIRSVMASFGLCAEFPPDVEKEAGALSTSFDGSASGKREDLTGMTIITIDPETARDYDDAISLEDRGKGSSRLGVHIADVSHFVTEGSALDVEARQRSLSVYFPGYVVPMLPPLLSNGLCSLQEGVSRYAMSVFIDYDANGEVGDVRACRSVIRSASRMTYAQAQGMIDGTAAAPSAEIGALLQGMNQLAGRIEARRQRAGMIHLNLPEIELLLDEAGKVRGAEPSDNAYTHKIIEMFMVEANEAVARMLRDREAPLMRRIHPSPDEESLEQLCRFVRACGYDIATCPTIRDLIRIVEQSEGRPESYALNLAVLRSFQRAVYSVAPEGHFALASDCYAHFTSPIRRYPDLLLHRELGRQLERGKREDDMAAWETLSTAADYASVRERAAQAAETELRLVLVLQYLAQKKGEVFGGIITGVTEFGLFVQHPVFLIEGLIRLPDLGDDWWEVASDEGKVRGSYSGKVFRIGDVLESRIDGVDVARRQLILAPSDAPLPRLRTRSLDDVPRSDRAAAKTGRTGKPKTSSPSPAGRPRRAVGMSPKSGRTGNTGTGKTGTGKTGTGKTGARRSGKRGQGRS